MKKIALILSVVLLAAVFVKIGLQYLPHTIVQEDSQREFVLDSSFTDIRRTILQGRFEQETLRINESEMIAKKWTDIHVNLQKPLQKDRFFEFNGRMLARVRVNTPQLGKIEIELIEDVCIATDRVEVITRLNKPLPIGISDIVQSIYIYPENNKTKVELKDKIILKRYIPGFMEKQVRDEVKKATEDSIAKMEDAIRNLKPTR